MNKHILFLLFSLPFLVISAADLQAQSKIKSVPFAYRPDASDDRYNQRLKHKTLPVSETDFVILSKKTDTEFAVERYNERLEKTWSAVLPLTSGETVEAFSKSEAGVSVLTHRTNEEVGSQTLTGHLFDLKNGSKLETKKLFEAPAKSRKIAVSISEDGSKIAAFQYLMQEAKIKAIQAGIFDSRFQKLKDQNYNLRDIATNISASLKIDNRGDQFLCLLSDNATKLTVRKYTNASDEVKVMSVQLGGMFSGRQVYVFQTQYQLQQNGLLYAAALTLDRNTSDYHSLKLVKFDFAASEMAFAPEFKFTQEYIDSLNKYYPSDKPVKRLEDIELSQMVITPEKDVVLIAEKRYTEGSENSNYVAKELHLFTYDEYLNLAWRSILMKNQVSPPDEGFSGISYLANYVNGALHILTLETINGKTDLYNRRINAHNGAGENPKAIGLNVANDKNVAYIKDFTAWLNDRTLVVVSRPSKKSASLQLNRIIFK
ncbi:hypothetical protein I5M27_15685 [Adhaeribacter sp. BT258]|uniref:Uncharacterized protein n=1 Tax=Adhaeribacter terrigena TaxID=2793070 RepID=A0ABS1C4W3_9BACT|nr:hypothetical protein [Adhaeribacter terrigena]MBK0404440.1 hypothetical protein [Adhaeribacter terrigena]